MDQNKASINESASKLKTRIIWLLVILAIFAADQMTKQTVRDNIYEGRSISIVEDFFYFTHIENRGAAFGMFANLPDGWREIFLTTLNLLALTLVVFYSIKLSIKLWLPQLALHMIFAGAIGNLADRFMAGSVTDFLLFKFWGWSFPAFNVADSSIVIGVTLLLFDTLFLRQDDEEKPVDPAADAISAGVEMDLVGAKPAGSAEEIKSQEDDGDN